MKTFILETLGEATYSGTIIGLAAQLHDDPSIDWSEMERDTLEIIMCAPHTIDEKREKRYIKEVMELIESHPLIHVYDPCDVLSQATYDFAGISSN